MTRPQSQPSDEIFVFDSVIHYGPLPLDKLTEAVRRLASKLLDEQHVYTNQASYKREVSEQHAAGQGEAAEEASVARVGDVVAENGHTWINGDSACERCGADAFSFDRMSPCVPAPVAAPPSAVEEPASGRGELSGETAWGDLPQDIAEMLQHRSFVAGYNHALVDAEIADNDSKVEAAQPLPAEDTEQVKRARDAFARMPAPIAGREVGPFAYYLAGFVAGEAAPPVPVAGEAPNGEPPGERYGSSYWMSIEQKMRLARDEARKERDEALAQVEALTKSLRVLEVEIIETRNRFRNERAGRLDAEQALTAEKTAHEAIRRESAALLEQERAHSLALRGRVAELEKEGVAMRADVEGLEITRLVDERDAALKSAAEATERAGRLEAQLNSLPEHFDLSCFVRAGLDMAAATTALMVARRVLEDAESEPPAGATSDRPIVIGSTWLEEARNLESHVTELRDSLGVRVERISNGRLTGCWFGGTPEAMRDARLRNAIFGCVEQHPTEPKIATWHYGKALQLISDYRAELTTEREHLEEGARLLIIDENHPDWCNGSYRFDDYAPRLKRWREAERIRKAAAGAGEI